MGGQWTSALNLGTTFDQIWAAVLYQKLFPKPNIRVLGDFKQLLLRAHSPEETVIACLQILCLAANCSHQ